MTYMKPEMEIEKFDLVEEITAEADSAAVAGGDTNAEDPAANADTNSIGSDLIIG